MTYPTLPEDLQQLIDKVAFVYEPAMAAGRQYQEAMDAYKELYEKIKAKQPPNGRYHKGYPLHNIGYTMFRLGNGVPALHYFILAYIEDLLSENKGEEEKANDTAAGKFLRQIYKVRESYLKTLQEIVFNMKESGITVSDPETILTDLTELSKSTKEYKKDMAKLIEKFPDSSPIEKRIPGMFDKIWEKRVFIGASYKELYVINSIKTIVEQKGYEPIVALDFDIPSTLIHHHSLMLLHECKYAIFDLSQEAGQLMEIERVIDYEIKTIAVYQAAGGDPKITEMLKAHLTAMNIPTRAYCNNEELTGIINSFLP